MRKLLLVLGLGVLGASVTCIRAHRLPATALTPARQDVWFNADIPGVTRSMIDRHDPFGGRRHPLFPLVGYSATKALRVIGLSTRSALVGVVAMMAGVWTAALALLLLELALTPVDVLLFCLVGLASAAATLFASIPERFALGGASVLFAVWMGMRYRKRRVDLGFPVAALVATLGVTVTNGAVGVLAVVIGSRPLRRIMGIISLGIVVLLLAWAAERLLIPTVPFPVGRYSVAADVYPLTAGRLHAAGRGLLVSPAVLPTLGACENRMGGVLHQDVPRLLTVQRTPMPTAALPVIAMLAWCLLLACGVFALRSIPRPVVLLLVGALAVNALHLRFGGETALYSMHPWSALVPIAALGLLTRFRSLARAAAIVFVLTATPWNETQRERAARFASEPTRVSVASAPACTTG